jgi:hypothetical protein
MQRRDLLRILGASAVLPFVPRGAGAAIAFGRSRPRALPVAGFEALSPAQGALVTAITELIIPRTDTPGAIDAGVPAFIDHLLAHWYADAAREEFLTGLDQIPVRAGGSFFSLEPDRQMEFLSTLDGVKGARGSAESAFAMLKSLTVYGYFTSERVVKEVTRDPIIPGRFDGCARL